MNCRRAQSDIALWAGNDLDESSLFELRDHLEVCPACRAYQEQMQALMRLMEECPLRDEVDETSKLAVECSLWPSLASRLISLPVSRTGRFNGWVPAVAVAAVCFAMVLVASPPQLLSPQDAAVPVAAEEGWTINHSPQAHADAATSLPSPRFPITGTSVEFREGEDLRAIARQRRAALREFWAREMENFPPTLMQNSGLIPRIHEEPGRFHIGRPRAGVPIGNDLFDE